MPIKFRNLLYLFCFVLLCSCRNEPGQAKEPLIFKEVREIDFEYDSLPNYIPQVRQAIKDGEITFGKVYSNKEFSVTVIYNNKSHELFVKNVLYYAEANNRKVLLFTFHPNPVVEDAVLIEFEDGDTPTCYGFIESNVKSLSIAVLNGKNFYNVLTGEITDEGTTITYSHCFISGNNGFSEVKSSGEIDSNAIHETR